MRRLGLEVLLFAALIGTAGAVSTGCSSDGNQPPAAGAECATPLRGQRYAVCGHLSTAGAAAPGGSQWVIGSVDSTVAGGTSKYTTGRGTFHANH